MRQDNVDINFFYYPTTIAIVDDSESFLSSMQLQLSKTWATVLFSDPEEALQAIRENEKKSNEFQHEFISIPVGSIEQDNKRTLDVNISNSYKKIYDPERFSEICVAIVDYDIPGKIDGLEFCEKLTKEEKSHVRVVMLTGKAGDSLAVNAFNNGRIHRFLVKGVNDSRDEINMVLKVETNKSFCQRAEILRRHFLVQTSMSANGDEYKKIFNMVLENSGAVEYYLLDYSGSFLFLDENARPTFLLVKSSEDLENNYKIAKGAEANDNIVKKLKEKTHLLQLLNDDDYSLSPEDWADYLHPAVKAERGDFYYSVVTKEIAGIDLNGVLSFNEYLSGLK